MKAHRPRDDWEVMIFNAVLKKRMRNEPSPRRRPARDWIREWNTRHPDYKQMRLRSRALPPDWWADMQRDIQRDREARDRAARKADDD